jgi:GAF domain-containing protein
MVLRYTRLPADFIDRLRDLLCTVQSEQLMMRPDGDDDRLERIVRLAVKQTSAEIGSLLLVNEDRGDLQVAAAVGAAIEPLVGKFISRTTLAGFAVDDGQPVAVANTSPDSASSDEVDQRTGLVTRNLLAVPLIIHGQSSGALELRNSPAEKGFGPDDVELATELAYLASAAVEEFRGDRFLFALFAAALPRALDATRGAEADSLVDELTRWLAELRQSSAWRKQVELVELVRELCRSSEDSVTLATTILEALVANQRRRRTLLDV